MMTYTQFIATREISDVKQICLCYGQTSLSIAETCEIYGISISCFKKIIKDAIIYSLISDELANSIRFKSILNTKKHCKIAKSSENYYGFLFEQRYLVKKIREEISLIQFQISEFENYSLPDENQFYNLDSLNFRLSKLQKKLELI